MRTEVGGKLVLLVDDIVSWAEGLFGGKGWAYCCWLYGWNLPEPQRLG